MKKLIIAIIIVLLPTVASAATWYASSSGSGTTCSSASPCGLEYAVETKASAGDTVIAKAGTYSITSTITINKTLTLQGEGNTVTIFNIAASHGIEMAPATPATDVVRITAIKFDSSAYLADNHTIVYIDDGLHQMVDNCVFNQGHDCINTTGYLEGVIYSNTFTNCEVGIRIKADNDTSWAREISAGTEHSLFIEDNTFEINNSFPGAYGGPEQSIYFQEGGRAVVRYNDFNYTYTGTSFAVYDSHGNWGGADRLDYRGQPLVELYENTFTLNNAGINSFYWRGGSIIAYNNTITTDNLSDIHFVLTDEEDWTSGGPFGAPPAPDSTWPANDQIFNSFFWNNTINGSNVDVTNRYSSDSAFIVENRDYWLHAPAASGGKTTWTGAAGLESSHSFSSSGANAYYPYTPYTYPHPLRGESDTTAPTVTGGTIAAAGTTITVTFSESVVMTDYDTGEFDLDCSTSGVDINLSSASGSGASWSFTIADTIGAGEVCNIDFTGDANSIEDTSSNDLATFSNTSVTNNSTVDITSPVVTITSPTSSSTYSTSISTITLAGSSSTDTSYVTYSLAAGGNGNCTGTSSWTCSSISLTSGSNVISVNAYDGSGNLGTDAINVTYTPPTNTGCTIMGGTLR